MKPTIIPRPQQIINKKGELEKARAEREEAWLLEELAEEIEHRLNAQRIEFELKTL